MLRSVLTVLPKSDHRPVGAAKRGGAKTQPPNASFCFVHINKCGGTSIEKALGIPKIHRTAAQWREALGADRWERMFTFALVRHPFEKVSSHYRYRVRTNQTGLGDRRLSLNDWVRLAYGERDPRYYDKPLMFAPCLEWIVDQQGEVLVDHVAKLENIAQEWTYIAAMTGGPSELRLENATERSQESLDQTSRNIILERFRPDFEAFGY
jgi:hypothetical protein